LKIVYRLDPSIVVVKKTNPERGPLTENWTKEFQETNRPVMCSYKIVRAKFEVWGFQTRVEAWAQKVEQIILTSNLLI
jgi:hypothetical protein